MNALLKPSPLGTMHADEWAARLELAACYRIFAMLGWTEMIYKHITVRLPSSVTGSSKQSVTPEAAARSTRDALQFEPKHGAGQDMFAALTRQVTRIDASYQQ